MLKETDLKVKLKRFAFSKLCVLNYYNILQYHHSLQDRLSSPTVTL